MSLPINGFTGGIPSVPLPPTLGGARAGEGAQVGGASGSFQDLLLKSLNEVNGMQVEANRAVESLATGGDVNPAEVLTAVQKADLAFRMTMQIRNKLVQAYQEIQNIRI